jgi:hypothetical protein
VIVKIFSEASPITIRTKSPPGWGNPFAKAIELHREDRSAVD